MTVTEPVVREGCKTDCMDLATSAEEMGAIPEEVLALFTALAISHEVGGVDVCTNGVAENKEG